jgi:hypothetical protein
MSLLLFPISLPFILHLPQLHPFPQAHTPLWASLAGKPSGTFQNSLFLKKSRGLPETFQNPGGTFRITFLTNEREKMCQGAHYKTKLNARSGFISNIK